MIPITKPFFGEEEKRLVIEALESGWVVQGPHTHALEEKFGKFVNVKHSLATTSCTTALHLALIAEGIKTGHDVILPSFTFIATANTIEYVGATPVFCDIDLTTFNIDIQALNAVIENQYEHIDGILFNKVTKNQLKAIMPVHLFGLAADMLEINKLRDQYGLHIIEDAACALGASIDGTHVGAFGNIACFSLHPRKAITTGEGGIVTSDSDESADLVNALRNHGATVSDLQRHVKAGYLLPDYNLLGYNYRLTDIQGAIGNAQMNQLALILEGRNARAQRYNEKLKDISWLKIPTCPDGYVHGYQSYVCLVDYKALGLSSIEEGHDWRNALMVKMENDGIATRQGTHAVHTLGYYREKYQLELYDFEKSYEADRLSISLPLYIQMTDEEQDLVINYFLAQ